jgi:cardiolipin synthase A/B
MQDLLGAAALSVLAAIGCQDREATPSSSGTGSAPGSVASSAAGTTAGGSLPIDTRPACSPDVPRSVPLQVWAEPEAGQAPFVDALSSARTSIRVLAYEMGPGGVLATIAQKARAGVKVRVILDRWQRSMNLGTFDQLTAAGAEVAWSNPSFAHMHAKAMVIDDKIAVISTGNFAASQMAQERDYVARDEDPADVASLAALFDADWARLSPDVSCTRLLVSPVNARRRLLDLIGGATRTLDIESMQLADTDVRSAIIARRRAGVAVRVLLAAPGWVAANAVAAASLKQSGIPVRVLVSPGVHVKAMTVDGQRAYLGSENLSHTSLDKNREVGLIAIEGDVIRTLSSTFEKDWTAATPS